MDASLLIAPGNEQTKPDGICNPVRSVLCVEGYRLVRTKRKRRGYKPHHARQPDHCHITLRLRFYVASLRRCVRQKNLYPLNDMPYCEKGKRRSHATAQRRNVKSKAEPTWPTVK